MGRALKVAALLIGPLLGLGVGSLASAQTCAPTQDPNVCVTVAGAPSVAYSAPGAPTYWTITVQIANNAANTLNRVRFTGTLTDTAVDPGSVYFVDPTTGQVSANPVFVNNGDATITCALTAPTSIACGGTLGTSIPAGKTLSFNLMTTTPANEARIDLEWDSFFAEGSSTSGGADNGAAQASGALSTSVSAPTGNSAAASFPASGGTLATAPDAFSTKITIPATAKSTTASINESPVAFDARCRSFKTCYASDVSIPGFVTDGSAFLRIDLWMDASNIKKGTKIENVRILYTGKDIHGIQFTDYPVDLCPAADTPLQTGLPCINKRTFFRNKQVDGWTVERDGDYYWEAINIQNGGFVLF